MGEFRAQPRTQATPRAGPAQATRARWEPGMAADAANRKIFYYRPCRPCRWVSYIMPRSLLATVPGESPGCFSVSARIEPAGFVRDASGKWQSANINRCDARTKTEHNKIHESIFAEPPHRLLLPRLIRMDIEPSRSAGPGPHSRSD